MKSLSVLVADDEEDIRTLLQLWLKADGHRIICVGNATEAARVMDRLKFDLIITDILMPDGDGLQLISNFKAGQPEVRIVAMSGGGRYMERDNCLKIARGFGAHAAVMKPFDRAQLMDAVALALAPAEKS